MVHSLTWCLEWSRHSYKVVVICPRCNKPGRLSIMWKEKGRKLKYPVYVVQHQSGRCHFGWTSSEYEILKKIHQEIKERIAGRKLTLRIRI